MPYVTKEQIAKARQMDLLTYLAQYEPEELVHFSGNTYTTRTHDSLKISNGKWCWWSRGIGGTTALDYLIHVRGHTLPEAVSILINMDTCTRSPPPSQEYSLPAFTLPARHIDDRRVFSYLKSRGIDPEIINHCMKHGQLYEDAAHHNCVFVGFEGDTPRYAALRGTLSGTAFMGEVPGSDKRFSFAVPKRANAHPVLCVFESAIDALSYLSLIKLREQHWRQANCLSLAGVYRPRGHPEIKCPLALGQYLKDNPQIKNVILCLDNDETGRLAAQAIHKHLEPVYTVVDYPPRIGKDYNDLLRLEKGILGNIKTHGEPIR